MTEHTTKLDAVGTNDCKVTTETLHAQPAAPPTTTQYKFVNQTLYPCKAQPECLHDEYQYQTCSACNPVVAPDTRHAEAQEPNRFIPDMAHCARCKKADNLHSPDGICPPQEPHKEMVYGEVAIGWRPGFVTAGPFIHPNACWTPEQAEQLSDLLRQCAELARGAQEPKAQETEYDKAVTALVEAAEKMESKIAEIENSASYKSVWQLAYLHGHRYAGPNYALEVRALRTAIAAVKEKMAK